MRSRVVVTGVAGFIGSNLADRLLAEGFKVVGVDNLAYGLAEQVPEGVEFHRLDIRDPGLGEVFRGARAIFHLAAKNCIPDCQTDPVETAAINVLGTVNVFEAAARAGVPRVIYAESAALYEGDPRLPSAEESLAPQSFYALSKMAARHFAEGFRRHRGLDLTALRYFCVYGPRQDYRRSLPPVMSAFILRLLRGQRPIIYGDGSKRRDFVHVDDVNDFHLQCLTDPRTRNGVFNLGSGRSHSVREILDLVCDIMGVSAEPEFHPDLPGEAQETRADISRARALGWEPRTPLRKGLEEMVAYIKEHVPL
ncbi:MAG TPA: NAD-dependent epimerase/dehydratase family protein [Candidatus Nitrosotenuis sp.]|jgi:nucleoside-diphosphate-sugar epimerase|nr:NAD-dependent epimerase/dehydratase family protein [Candidatus Nitrosotenuis sp.]